MFFQLQKMRKRAGFKSQKEAADALGVPERRYASWEREEAMPNLEQVYYCAKLFECSIDEIAGYEPPSDRTSKEIEQLKNYYLSMNSEGRESLLKTARLMSGSPETRIERTGESVEISPSVA